MPRNASDSRRIHSKLNLKTLLHELGRGWKVVGVGVQPAAIWAWTYVLVWVCKCVRVAVNEFKFFDKFSSLIKVIS